MSKLPDTTPSQANTEHGTVASYVVGFLLSLVFTAIPYYLVVNNTIAGDALVATILGFAVLQMAVQIFFFLHLGRGPKPLYNVAFFISTVGIILLVVFGSIFIMDHLNYNMMSPKESATKLAQNEGIAQVGGARTGACADIGTNHQIVIQNGKPTPLHVEAKRCDSLSFINKDSTIREITFGAYPDHENYGGEKGVTVRSGRSKTITLNQLGTHLFHDHLQPELSGSFTVIEKDG